ncbi:MAG: hypothetical protein IANPNBLG_01292 [Bryobacteraceae bacterium]|nr:hypothetical protein [Bryobacteraceae bacterium]
MACTVCHAGAQRKEAAGFPPVSQCRVCHKDYAAAIPSRRVYQLPDFVFFSHASHVKAECRSCHGDVWEQEKVTVFRMPKMKECVDCHKERHAPEQCNTCHELGQ